MTNDTQPGADIVADARKRLANRAGRESTHSKYCHEWHDACLIARLVDECDRLRESHGPLTDDEREAVERAAVAYGSLPTVGAKQVSALLRAFLARFGGSR